MLAVYKKYILDINTPIPIYFFGIYFLTKINKCDMILTIKSYFAEWQKTQTMTGVFDAFKKYFIRSM